MSIYIPETVMAMLADYFNYIDSFVTFKQWYFGHYHEDITSSDDKYVLCYHNFYPLKD